MIKNGLSALLTLEESVLLLIDHQPFQISNLHSHDPTMIINNVVGLAKVAWQRDWARAETLEGLSLALSDHAGGTAAALAWEGQLLAPLTEPVAQAG